MVEKEHEMSMRPINKGFNKRAVVLSPPTAVFRLCELLQDAVGPIQVPGGRRSEAPELADGLAHGAGIVRQALDVFKGQVDDLVTAGVAVEVSAGEALQTHLVGDAALAVRCVWTQRQGASQGAALQAPSLDGALLGGWPVEKRAVQLKRCDQALWNSAHYKKCWLQHSKYGLCESYNHKQVDFSSKLERR